MAALTAADIAFRVDGLQLHVFARPIEVGRIAVEQRVVMTELRTQQDGLEDLFLTLTAETQRDPADTTHEPQTAGAPS
jgi:ABC-2 type transport system ATP-binding protein